MKTNVHLKSLWLVCGVCMLGVSVSLGGVWSVSFETFFVSCRVGGDGGDMCFVFFWGVCVRVYFDCVSNAFCNNFRFAMHVCPRKRSNF